MLLSGHLITLCYNWPKHAQTETEKLYTFNTLKWYYGNISLVTIEVTNYCETTNSTYCNPIRFERKRPLLDGQAQRLPDQCLQGKARRFGPRPVLTKRAQVPESAPGIR